MTTNQTYSEKLRDPRWQKMRLMIMERDDFRCRHCGVSDKTLNVHHAYYKPRHNPWDYPEDSLITFCESCHSLAEKRREFILRATVDPFIQLRAANLCHAMEGNPYPYAPSVGGLMDGVAGLITASELEAHSDTELGLAFIDAATAAIYEYTAKIREEWLEYASRKSLDELIAEAPEEPEDDS